jgi:hypothetical protein
LFEELWDRPLHAVFDEPGTSSDGGAVLLSAADRRLGLLSELSACVTDERDPARVQHEVEELLRERVFGIACGYEDGNDAGRLADDPIFKLIVGRDPAKGARLASQPTLSRFERSAGRKDLVRMGWRLAEKVIQRQRKRRGRRKKVSRITIDFDLTHDETHGQQPLAFFNGFYGVWCYLPMLGFIRFDEEPEQYLVAALLRPGNAAATTGLQPLLRRLVKLLRQTFPKTQLRLRLDAGFPSPKLLEYLESEGIEYVIGLAKNTRLEELTADSMTRARTAAEKSGQTERFYEVCRYGARSWNRLRRVVFKAEVTVFPGRALRDNLRLVLTNLEQRTAQEIWEEDYCSRGEIENRIKELKDGLKIDRTSSSSFFANQLRVLMTAAAYAILQELRAHATRTRFARAQIGTLRDHLLKVGVRVVASVRRIVLHLPASCPAQRDWQRIAAALGARAG